MMNPIVRLFALYWIWAAVVCHILSFAHALTPLWMGIAHLSLLPFVWREAKRGRWSFKWRRYRHGLPLLFAILVVLLAIGSIASGVPKQADYLEYRLFRMMRWWEYGRIAFIPDALGGRANYSGTAQECAILPTLLLFKTDRIAMLFSWTAFATLPGLTFRFARLIGARLRVAWILAWGLPASYAMCVAQAGGGGNDIYGVWFVLLLGILLMELGERGFESLPFLAGVAGVFSNIKTSNEVLLAILGIVAIAKLWKWRRSIRLLPFAATVALFALCSVIPLLRLNWIHYGSIAGNPPVREVETTGGISAKPALPDAIIVNATTILASMVQPPVLPSSDRIGSLLNDGLGLRGPLRRCASENGGFGKLLLLQTEENAGAGLFWTLLLVMAVLGFRTNRRPALPATRLFFALLPLSIAVLFLVLSKMGVMFGGWTRIMGCYWYLFGLVLAVVCSARWSGRHIRRMRACSAVCLLGGMAIAAVVPTRMLIPEPLFVRASSLVSPALGRRAAETASAYSNHGGEFAGLSPVRAIGPVAYANHYCYMSAYWRLSDTKRLSPAWTTPILCKTPDELFRHDTIVLTSFDRSQWELPDIETCASAHAYRILGHTTALFKRKDGLMDAWLLSRP